MLSAWFRSTTSAASEKQVFGDETIVSERQIADEKQIANERQPINADSDNAAGETLIELERMQAERLDALMSKLLEHQMKVLEKLTQHATRSENCAAAQAAGMQDLLIQGELVALSQAVLLRQQSIDKYLHDRSVKKSSNPSGQTT